MGSFFDGIKKGFIIGPFIWLLIFYLIFVNQINNFLYQFTGIGRLSEHFLEACNTIIVLYAILLLLYNVIYFRINEDNLLDIKKFFALICSLILNFMYSFDTISKILNPILSSNLGRIIYEVSIISLAILSIFGAIICFWKNKIQRLSQIIQFFQKANYLFLGILTCLILHSIFTGIIIDIGYPSIKYEGKCYVIAEKYITTYENTQSRGPERSRKHTSINEYLTLVLRKNNDYSNIPQIGTPLTNHNIETSDEIFIPISNQKTFGKLTDIKIPDGTELVWAQSALCKKNIRIEYLPNSRYIISLDTY